jgi:hypothetical protein
MVAVIAFAIGLLVGGVISTIALSLCLIAREEEKNN